MTVTRYIATLSSLVMSVWFIPDWQELFKVYVISVVALVTVLINLLFRIHKLRELIVTQLVADVIQQIFKDRDVQKLIEWSQATERIRSRVREELKKREQDGGSGS